jgi:hypothetical protein
MTLLGLMPVYILKLYPRVTYYFKAFSIVYKIVHQHNTSMVRNEFLAEISELMKTVINHLFEICALTLITSSFKARSI